MAISDKLSRAQTPTWSSFPGKETLQSQYGDREGNRQSGHACSLDGNPSRGAHFRSMLVSPTSVTTEEGKPITIRYDASGLCMGQGYADVSTLVLVGNGHVIKAGDADWAAGIIQTLPDNGQTSCSASVSIPITVTKKSVTKKK